MTCVTDDAERLLGIITDGDLRRHMDDAADIRSLTAADVMTRGPVTISPSTLAAEALNVRETRKITSMVVFNGDGGRVAGVVHLHDLWRTEMF
jgi:arabinose-5-phosphate isomerase